MAYINQDKKKEIAVALRVAMKAFPNVKYSLSVSHHSTLVCTISQGDKFLNPENKENYDINTYHIDSFYSEEAAEVFNVIKTCMNTGNHDRSDIMSDYFDVGWYLDIKVGRWDKPFIGV